jgi:hypothetical protein
VNAFDNGSTRCREKAAAVLFTANLWAAQKLREGHFDQVDRDLRLPRDGGDYEVRPFPLPTSPVDTGEMRVGFATP